MPPQPTRLLTQSQWGKRNFLSGETKKSAFGKFVIGLVDAAFFEAQPEKLDEARCQQRFILYAGKYLP